MSIKLLTLFVISSFIISCTQEKAWTIKNVNSNYLAIDSQNVGKSDSAMLAEIAPYKAKLDSAMGEVISYCPKEYFKKKPNGSLNNIVSDMVFDVINKRYKDSPYQPDLCLLNYGGLRRPLPKGEITKSSIYQLMPFQNESVICRLSGKQMNKMFEYLLKTNGQPIANMKVFYKGGEFVGATINGLPYDSTKSYNVLTSDYTAKGGDHMDFFLEADTMILCGSLLRNDIFEYIDSLEGKELKANEEDRIIIE